MPCGAGTWAEGQIGSSGRNLRGEQPRNLAISLMWIMLYFVRDYIFKVLVFGKPFLNLFYLSLGCRYILVQSFIYLLLCVQFFCNLVYIKL